MYQNVTIDLETLDTESTAKILSIGIVPFDWEEKPGFEELLNRESSLYLKVDVSSFPSSFTENQSTKDWWEGQGEQAKHVLEPCDTDIPIALALDIIVDHLSRYVAPIAKDGGLVFCRGYDFDGGILNHAFEQMDTPKPWHYNRFRCIRTLIDTISGSVNGYVRESNPQGFVAHHALHDAAKDTLTMLTLKQGVVNG